MNRSVIDSEQELGSVDLTSCDQEAIHIPSSIQPTGVLIAVTRADLIVTHASLNLGDWLGYTPRAALGRSVRQLLGEDGYRAVQAELAHERVLWGKVLAIEPPRSVVPLQLVMHAMGDLVCMELEPAPPAADWSEGTQRALAVMQALRTASSQLELCNVVASKLRELTGYDRVMVYRFQREGHGEVIAESRDPDLDPYLGQSYPASDIPRQARRLYLAQRIRIIADADYVAVPVLSDPALGSLPPLDMTHCALRSVSPIHLEYMRNMGVYGSLAVSLIPATSLWGMVVCHHRTPRFIPADIRSQIDMIGQLVSLLLGSLGEMETYAQQLHRQHALQEVVARMATSEQVADGLQAAGDALLSALDATGAVARVAGRTLTFGAAPPEAAARRAMTVLDTASGGNAAAVDELQGCVPDWQEYRAIASGALFMPLSTRPEDGIIWFRPELEREVKWAGDPRKPAKPNASTGRISPRESFAVWRELVRGRSAPWLESDRAIAREFQLIMTSAIARQAEIEKAKLSDYDPLTGLANRRMFQERLAVQAADPTVALLCIDLDRFKSVNDTFGHPTGDALLCAVASRLKFCVREDDLIVRLGGDEFAIVQTGAEQPLSAETAAQRIVDRLGQVFDLGEHQVSIGASVGIAFAHGSAGDARTLLKHADIALYRAKEQGRGTFRVFRPEFQGDLEARTALEAELRNALPGRQLELFYQPMMDTKAATLCGFEALLRWRHPTAGLLSPADFLSLAEATGLIVPIGTWVLHQACRQATAWPDDIKVAVNLSAAQIQSALIATTRDALAQSGLRPGRLELEITETALLHNNEAIAVLQQLRALGVRIVLDDFGVGYSTLRNLLDFDFDSIKIDRSFVRDIGRDQRSIAIVRAVIALVQSLQTEVTAEGVETTEQFLQIRAEGCSRAQGHLFSVPVEAAKLPGLLARASRAEPAAALHAV